MLSFIAVLNDLSLFQELVFNLCFEQFPNQVIKLSMFLELQVIYIPQLNLRLIYAKREVNVADLLLRMFIFELECWQKRYDINLLICRPHH